MTTSHWLRPHHFKTSDLNADVVIVGSGYVGLSTAYWLSQFRPDLKILVLDRSMVGSGASGRNAGFLTKGSATFYKTLTKAWGSEKALKLYTYAQESLNLVHQNILKSSPEIKFEKTSSMTLFQDHETLQKWRDDQFDPARFGFTWTSDMQLQQFIGAYENGMEYKVDPIQLLMSLKKILEGRKIQVIENLSAYELTPDGLKTEYNLIKCKQVVLAINGYFPQFHPSFKKLITPYRAQMLAVELENEFPSGSLHYDSPERIYFRRSNERTLIIGGKRLLDEAGEVGDYEKISPIIQSGLEKYLSDVLKISYKVIHRWSGIMGFTTQELPMLSQIEAPLETFVVGGFSGHGMGFGFKAAQEMAEMVTGKISTSIFDTFNPVKIKL